MSSTTVLISGASGFIALHTVQELVKQGYNVVGSVRSEEKGEYVKKASGNPEKFTYEIVEDIEKEGAFDDFVKKHPEATVFLHTASPFHFIAPDVERDLLLPAINGTKNALKSIKENGSNIKRVVVTSSYAAIASPEKSKQAGKEWDESSWNDITWEQALENPFLGYFGSKTFAEKAAWDFVKEEKPGFVLSTVNPVYVFGPQPTNEFNSTQLNTSSEIINSILKIKDTEAKVNSYNGAAVDVRDVAKAHLVAFEKDEAKEQRLLLSSGKFTQQTVLDVLHVNFPSEAQHVPIGEPGSDREEIKTTASPKNDKTRKILGFELISVEQSIVDSAKQILEVEDKLKTTDLNSKHQQL
ncbi:hypothetical protein FT663_02783 [Candidozyma haemuli var. vulneris]|uniref:NAD-dependent epimerase/dehydratase domain-containing protein n=1 Tax=Candidozyma haemuli TaxID=45357 RepID=A0A2V1B0L6_9ASCO|nr:hypothetical protein CXQ85_005245 [[Candida] haemuloni]KAF3991282.1 hypothetical protein FT663_02783 [[Candida] haemuloni var. vulneris]KAF3991968.1 hypothetical protein FT662_01421 [[Candida] haemuloni var. vulneris]PVH22671.1 hypothetical protein CXQ85_005245 [[Candida] haemuloni]